MDAIPGELLTATAPVRGGALCFVRAVDSADSVGQQWQRYRRVQLDSETGKSISRDRLFGGTRWPPKQLEGELVLEVGCCAGRFTEVLLVPRDPAATDHRVVHPAVAADRQQAEVGPAPRTLPRRDRPVLESARPVRADL